MPHLDFIELNDFSCCGASGLYTFQHPKLSEQIALPYIEAIKKANIDTILSSDTSCGLHLKEQLEQNGHTIKMMHPVAFIQNQIEIN